MCPSPTSSSSSSPEASNNNYSRASSEDEDGWSSGGSASPALMEDSSSFSATADCTTDISFRNEEDDDAAVAASAVPLFKHLRYTYLSVILVVYLADGLQGTHLYKLYDGYGFSVASLYCLGFFTGGVLSPVTGPFIDKMGRKRAAVLYCVLEILINAIEQLPYLPCLIACRVIGGLTTNLLHCVFETWLDCEFRSKQTIALKGATDRNAVEKAYQQAYELLMRDAVIISNTAAIGSGYLSHILAQASGPVGPFRGAVVCTVIALCVVSFLWTENYGGHAEKSSDDKKKEGEEGAIVEEEQEQSMFEFLKQAVEAFAADPRMLRVGIVQGFSVGSLQIFVFLWSPILIKLAQEVPADQKATTWGLDEHGEPAFGLIFMFYMGACVVGGMISPSLRQVATAILTPIAATHSNHVPSEVSQGSVRPMAVEFLAALCYLTAAGMLMVPVLVGGNHAFSWTLGAFCLYELVVGIVSPCEGVIRSLYFPAHARASVWTLPSFMVNTAVSVAVFSTQFVSLLTVCSVIVCLMMCASVLQISLISAAEWSTLRTHVKSSPRYARSLSFSVYESAKREPEKLMRRISGRDWANASASSVVPSQQQHREKQE